MYNIMAAGMVAGEPHDSKGSTLDSRFSSNNRVTPSLSRPYPSTAINPQSSRNILAVEEEYGLILIVKDTVSCQQTSLFHSRGS